jgi:hypothetical protein
MSLNLSQYKSLVVVPVLAALGAVQPRLNTPAGINLLTGTPLVESRFDYLAQFPTGPARGFDQIETDTLDDQYATFLDYAANSYLRAAVNSFAFSGLSHEDQMHGNLYFGCAIARIKYWRAPEPLPLATDALGLAQYHHDHYNSGGRANVVVNTPMFQQAIDA